MFVEDNALQVHVVALRRALAHEAGRLITVRGQGYRRNLRAADHSDSAGARSVASPRYAIAVLPFVNFTPFPDMEYFADGLTDELICLLSRLPDIYAPAMHSVFAYKGRHEDIRRIADTLGVAYALEGGVRLQAHRNVRILPADMRRR